MKKNAAIISGLLLLLFISCTNQNNDQRIELINKFLHGQADYYNFNGNVLIAEKGNILFQKSFGFSDYDNQIPLNDSSLFELASIGKQFTAMGILMLENNELLSLDDSLRKFFPELPYYKIKIHHLLTHTSGLPDYGELLDYKWNHKEIAFNKDMISMLAKEKPATYFKPGEKWEYCNTGYALLASIIEKVTGLTFKDFMQKNIFTPLQMEHTRVYNTRRSGEILANYAYGYVYSDSLERYILPDSLPDYNYVSFLDGIQGDGVINSTTSDLFKWDRFLNEKNLGFDTLVRKLMHPHVLCDSARIASYERYNGTSKLHYGYGVFIGKNEFGDFIYHGGQWPGYKTEIFHYINDDIAIIVLSNNESNATPTRYALSNIMSNRTIMYPEKHLEISLDTSVLDNFTGTYLLNNHEYEISREKDKLFMKYPFSKIKIKLSPESDCKIFWPDFDFQFEISKEDKSQIKYFQILFGTRLEMQKIK